MTDDTSPKKSEPAPKAESAPKAASSPSDGAAKSDATKSEASKADAAKPEGSAPSSYSRGEGQKPVTATYKDNWNAIYGKKAKAKPARSKTGKLKATKKNVAKAKKKTRR